MMRRMRTLLAVVMALAAAGPGAFLGSSSFRCCVLQCCVAGDDSPRNASRKEDVVQAARERVKAWSTLGMWLPEKDVPFFHRNFAATESVLRAALESPSKKIRQDAAYMVGELGPTALPLEPSLINRIEVEPERIVRLYLYAAARSISAKSPKLLAVMRSRFATLAKQPDAPAPGEHYTSVDERITLASALLQLDPLAPQRPAYRDFLLSWLKPPPKGLTPAQREDYWDHRWLAVTEIDNGGQPREAIPLLQAMLKEPDRKVWVYIKVSHALSALGEASLPKRVPGN
jgi:hypothetical protein